MRQLFIRQEQATKITGYSKSQISEFFKIIRQDYSKNYVDDYFKGAVLVADFARVLDIDKEIVYECLQEEKPISVDFIEKNKQNKAEILANIAQLESMIKKLI